MDERQTSSLKELWALLNKSNTEPAAQKDEGVLSGHREVGAKILW